MTIETRTTVEPADIKAIEFECPKCHSKISIALEKFRIPPTTCSVCDEAEQWLIPNSEEWKRIVQLGEALRALAATPRFKMRLEVEAGS